MRVLFVSNGHGEAAIADRIAGELAKLVPEAQLDHLALVGESFAESMQEVGPRRIMPSGGLIAMGAMRNILRDVGSGLIALTLAQHRFLRSMRGRYDGAVAVGDVYALIMTLAAHAPTVFVGTAKSVSVAPYGPLEERILRRAALRYVRDEATADRLRTHGLAVAPAANVITDLFSGADDPHAEQALEGFAPALALFPGSRESAYDDARFLLEVTRALASAEPLLGAVLSIARGLDVQRFVECARSDGWDADERDDPLIPFTLAADGRTVVRAWCGTLGALFGRVTLVLGQAGTANEAAAAAGVPVVAFERDRDRKTMWYRKRQRGLLGDALVVLPGNVDDAVRGVRALLSDAKRRERMAEVGRERMGAGCGATRIAQGISELTRQSA